MKVKHLIKELQKYPEDAIVSTFANDAYDFDYTPIAEIGKNDDRLVRRCARMSGFRRNCWRIVSAEIVMSLHHATSRAHEPPQVQLQAPHHRWVSPRSHAYA